MINQLISKDNEKKSVCLFFLYWYNVSGQDVNWSDMIKENRQTQLKYA